MNPRRSRLLEQTFVSLADLDSRHLSRYTVKTRDPNRALHFMNFNPVRWLFVNGKRELLITQRDK